MVSLVYPSRGFDSLSFKSKQPTLYDASSNGRSASRHVGGHMFYIGISHPELPRHLYAQIDGFLSYVGKSKKFLIVLPDRAEPQGVATGTPAVNNAGGYAKGISSINLKNLTPSVTGWFKENDFFKFQNHAKAHMCMQNLDSDVAGNGVLVFEPPLPQAVADGEPLVVRDVPFQVVCLNNHSHQVNLSRYGTNMMLMEAV